MTRRNEVVPIADAGLREILSRAQAAYERNERRLDHEIAADLERERAELERERALRLKKARVPRRAREAIMGGLVETEAVRQVDRLSREFTTLVLAGDTGTGKTVAAAAPLADQQGFFVTAPELAGFTRARDDRAELERLQLLPYLVIDDVGTEADRALVSRLDALLGRRHGERSATVITTNAKPEEFRRAYGERVWSRLHEGGDFFELVGPDLRRAS